MSKTQKKIYEEKYKFYGIPKKNQKKIIEVLSSCKEIRNTEYPMKNSLVTELKILDFSAHKEKDVISVVGNLILRDGEKTEQRCFEAYIMELEEEIKVYLDVDRLCVQDEPKKIRTKETLTKISNIIKTKTIYNSSDFQEEKEFKDEFLDTTIGEESLDINNNQLSAI